MGGAKTSTQTQNTNTQSQKTPWSSADPYFSPLYNQGAGAVASNQTLPMPTQFVAGANPTEQSAIGQTLAVVPTLGASGSSLSDMAQKVASGYFTNPQNNPNFSGAVTAALTPITQQLMEKTLPTVVNNSIMGGGVGGGPSAYGGANAGDAASIEGERAIRDWGKTAADTTSTMANNAYGQGLSLIPQAGNIANAADTQLLAPAAATGLAGTQQQTYSQQGINDLLQKYSTFLQAPWQGLQSFANLLTTGGFANNNTQSQMTGTNTTAAPDFATQLLQGGLGGAGILSSLFGAGAGGAPSAASNIWSGLGSLFGGGSRT